MWLLVFGGLAARVWPRPGRSRGGNRSGDYAIWRLQWRFAGLHLTIACWAGFSCGPLFAGQYEVGGGYSLTHDSNITHAPNGPPEWTSALFAGVAYEEHTVDLNARFLAQAEFRNYLRNVYQDDHSGYINGAAIWTISPQLFSWTVEENFRQVQVNLTQPDVPTNRTEVSAFSTGPNFTIRFDSTNAADIGGRYDRFDIRGPGDNQRLSGYGRLIHRVSPYTTLSANYEATRIDFDDSVTYPQVLRMDGFVRFETRVLPHELTIDVGTSRVIRYGSDELRGNLGRLTFARQLTPESTLEALYLSQYSDTFTDSLRGIANPMIPGDTAIVPGVAVVSGDPYYLRRGEMAFLSGAPGALFGYSLRGYARSVDFLTENFDFHEWGTWLDWAWRPSYLTSIYVTGRYSKRTFLDFPETDTDSFRAGGVTYGLNRSISLTFEVSRLSHTSTVPSSDYVDWRGMLLLGYSTGPLYSPVSRR